MIWVKAKYDNNSNYSSVAKIVRKKEIGKTTIRTPKYLITIKVNDTFINTNKTYQKLINVNPLKKHICRSLIRRVWKQERR